VISGSANQVRMKNRSQLPRLAPDDFLPADRGQEH
jgi:hypothetical protein